MCMHGILVLDLEVKVALVELVQANVAVLTAARVSDIHSVWLFGW